LEFFCHPFGVLAANRRQAKPVPEPLQEKMLAVAGSLHYHYREQNFQIIVKYQDDMFDFRSLQQSH
jgi:hypothetical protein